MKLKIIVWLSLMILFLTRCKGPEELSFEVIDYTSDNINFSGFYYNEVDYEYFMFYQNGVYHTAIATEKNLEWIEDYYADPSNYEGVEELPYFWGAYKETSVNSIEMEGWLSSDGGRGYPLYAKDGEIESSSAILIDGNIFLFSPLKSKPDSVLSWLNN